MGNHDWYTSRGGALAQVAFHENTSPFYMDGLFYSAERNQLQWFEAALAKSKAKWKIVLAHYPLWQSRSDSKYGQSVKLRELILPALCRYADAYIAGHEHTLELHTNDCGDEGNFYAPYDAPRIVGVEAEMRF